MISPADRRQAVALIDEANVAGARKSRACEALDISLRTYERWGSTGFEDDRKTRIQNPKSKLSDEERQAKLTTAHEVYSKLQALEDFSKLASVYSEDT